MKCSSARMFFDRMFREGDRFGRPDIAAHVRQCEHCCRDYEKWCGIARKLGSAAELDAPPALYGKVMREIGAQHNPARPSRFLLPWNLPAYGPALAALVLTIGIPLFVVRTGTVNRQTLTAPVVSDTPRQPPAGVVAHFELFLDDAEQVALVGDFNGWDKEKHLLARAEDGTWKIDLPLQNGCYQYQFLIDGKLWQPDPRRTQRIPDGFGGFNTVIEI